MATPVKTKPFDDNDFNVAATLYEGGQYEEALSKYEALAECGSVESQVLLGWMYLQGLGSKSDEQRAFDWFQRAAEQNSPEGEYYLAKLFFRRGDYSNALVYFQRSAAQDYAPAFFRLGRIHELGKGVQPSREKAFFYYEKAAKKGHIYGLKSLALMLMSGQYGVFARLKGVLIFLKALFNAVRIGWKDPYSEQIRD